MAAISVEQAGCVELVKFLDLIAFSEGTSTHPLTRCSGYDVIVTGVTGLEVFTDYADHPFANGRKPNVIHWGNPPLLSTASGRYQVLLRYWQSYKTKLNLKDFTPLSQDLVALQQIRERGAITHIVNEDIQTGIMLCRNIWASFPGNTYGQGGKTIAQLLDHYQSIEV